MITTKVTNIPSYKNVVKSEFDAKESKLKQKPLFKSRRKANPRLSQANKINKYFSSVGTAERGKGRGKSASFDDLNFKVLTQLGQDIRPNPRTYMDHGPSSL